MRRELLGFVRKVREGLIPARDLPFGRLILCIPVSDWSVLVALMPELSSPDAHTRTRAWQRFARSPASEPYRTVRRLRT